MTEIIESDEHKDQTEIHMLVFNGWVPMAKYFRRRRPAVNAV